MVEEELLEANADEILVDLDEYLYEDIMSFLENRNYDFLHGALGLAFYFLKRFINTTVSDLKFRYKNYLTVFIRKIKNMSEKDPAGLKWKSVIHPEKGVIGYNLSLSHACPVYTEHILKIYGNRVLLKNDMTFVIAQRRRKAFIDKLKQHYITF